MPLPADHYGDPAKRLEREQNRAHSCRRCVYSHRQTDRCIRDRREFPNLGHECTCWKARDKTPL